MTLLVILLLGDDVGEDARHAATGRRADLPRLLPDVGRCRLRPQVPTRHVLFTTYMDVNVVTGTNRTARVIE